MGPEKLLLLFVVALIVLGPSKLPEAARTIGKVLGEFRRISSGFQDEMRDAFLDPVSTTRESVAGAFGYPPSVSDPPAAGPVSSMESLTPPARPDMPAPPDDPSLN